MDNSDISDICTSNRVASEYVREANGCMGHIFRDGVNLTGVSLASMMYSINQIRH